MTCANIAGLGYRNGLTIGALMLARLAWRLGHPPPRLPAGMARWQDHGARASHFLLYAAFIAQPVIGYLGSSFTAYPIRYFGVELPAWSPGSPPLKALFSALHLGFACVITVLVVVPIAAGIRHRLLSDGVFDRMWLRADRSRAARRSNPLTSPE